MTHFYECLNCTNRQSYEWGTGRTYIGDYEFDDPSCNFCGSYLMESED